MKKVIVKKNVIGNGYDSHNAAVFATRYKFPENIWNEPSPEQAAAAGEEYVAILAIPGVISATSYSTSSLYDLNIKKATAYDWKEIEPNIVLLLEQRHDRIAAGK